MPGPYSAGQVLASGGQTENTWFRWAQGFGGASTAVHFGLVSVQAATTTARGSDACFSPFLPSAFGGTEHQLAAVAVAGQIAFVGLVVPHVLRLASGNSHRGLLPLSLLGGAVFLLAADLLNHQLLGVRALRPGVMLSLLGGPFFLVLVLRRRAEVRTW